MLALPEHVALPTILAESWVAKFLEVWRSNGTADWRRYDRMSRFPWACC
jgi:hypothetical protein